MTADVGAGVCPLVFVWTGAMVKGLGGGFSGICVACTVVPLGGSAVGVSVGTLGEGVGQYGWHTTAGVGRGALGAGDFGGLAVTLEKTRESVWMAEN